MKNYFYLITLFSILVISCKINEDKDVITKKDELISSTEKKIIKPKELVFSSSNNTDSTSTISKEIVDSKITSEPKKNKPIKLNKKSSPKPKKKQSKKSGVLSFSYDTYDFGFIEQGEVVNHSFNFRNIGNKEINISKATASCGCTTPVYPFLPIEPQKSGKIDVRFNSKGRLGSQHATIQVYSDASEEVIELHLKGIVRAEISENSPADSL